MEINYLNLKRMFNHMLENVPEDMIQMNSYRTEKYDTHWCNSVGCVIGHCTILDKWENIPKNYINKINFEIWSENFTGLISYTNNWKWCFGPLWQDEKEQILLRLKYFIDNQKTPDYWDYDYLLPIEKLELYKI